MFPQSCDLGFQQATFTFYCRLFLTWWSERPFPIHRIIWLPCGSQFTIRITQVQILLMTCRTQCELAPGDAPESCPTPCSWPPGLHACLPRAGASQLPPWRFSSHSVTFLPFMWCLPNSTSLKGHVQSISQQLCTLPLTSFSSYNLPKVIRSHCIIFVHSLSVSLTRIESPQRQYSNFQSI